MFSINISQEVEEFVGERGVCKVSLAMGLGGVACRVRLGRIVMNKN